MWRQQRKATLKPALGARPLLYNQQLQRSTEVGMDIDTPPNTWQHPPPPPQAAAPAPEVEMQDASPVRHHQQQQEPPMQHTVNRIAKVTSTRRRRTANNSNRSSPLMRNRSFTKQQTHQDATWEELTDEASQDEQDDDNSNSSDQQQHPQSSHRSVRRFRPTSNTSKEQQVLYYGDHHHHYATHPGSTTAPAAAAAWDPARASAWFALLVNTSVFGGAVSLFAYIIYVFIVDVRNKAKQQTRMYQSEITRCTQQYTLNHCGTYNQAPALSAMCTEWEQCFSRDPSSVASNYRLVAEVLADIVQGFLSPLAWKELAAVAVGMYLFVVLIARCTLAVFGQARTPPQHYPTQTSYPQPVYASLPPQQGSRGQLGWQQADHQQQQSSHSTEGRSSLRYLTR